MKETALPLPLPIRKWLEQQPVVIIGYFDEVRGINMTRLLELWRESDYLADEYPHMADHFLVKIVHKHEDQHEERAAYLAALSEFRTCPHIKKWFYGEPMP